jgi:antitoxin MazE
LRHEDGGAVEAAGAEVFEGLIGFLKRVAGGLCANADLGGEAEEIQCRYTMKTKIQCRGHSLALRVPKGLAQEAGFGEGDQVYLRADDDRIALERPRRRHYRLSDLLDGIAKRNRHDAVDFGGPVGAEVW